ncbi:hypothetical protein JHK82_025152 [Glycine max]|nr:hypothetical protein JHK82_025152 [Glycine max]
MKIVSIIVSSCRDPLHEELLLSSSGISLKPVWLHVLGCGPVRYSFLSLDLSNVGAMDSSFLYMGMLLEGFGVGIISYVVPVYIAEIAPQNLRGGLGSVN